MAKYKTYKFQQLAEMEFHLNGAVFGGDPRTPFFISAGMQLTFTQPTAAVVTFTAGAVPGQLSFPEFKSQVEAAVAGLKALLVGARLVLVEASPANGVVITGNIAGSNALTPLMMDYPGGATGRVYQYPDGVSSAAPPNYINSFFAEGHYFLLVRE